MIAVGIHIIVLLLSGLFPESSSWSGKNLIDVQFSQGPKGESGAFRQSIGKKIAGVKTKKSLMADEEALSGSAKAETSAVSEVTQVDMGQSSGNGGGSGFSFGDSVTSFSEPIYPRLAIKRNLEGQVRLRVKVSAEGLPEETTIIESSGHEILDNAAFHATKNWRFQKKAHPYTVEKNIVFKLR